MLKLLLCKMPVCKMVLTGDIKPSNILTIIFSASMYVFQVYQNINQCIRLKDYVIESHNELYTIKKYIEKGKKNIEKLLYITENMKSYEKFNSDILNFKNILEKYLLNLDNIDEGNINIIKNLGVIRSEYYSLYMNEKFCLTSLFYLATHYLWLNYLTYYKQVNKYYSHKVNCYR